MKFIQRSVQSEKNSQLHVGRVGAFPLDSIIYKGMGLAFNHETYINLQIRNQSSKTGTLYPISSVAMFLFALEN
jgi:hypothetical protein